MQHSYIDKYAGLDSFLHGLDPRAKVIVSFIFIFAVVLSNPTAYLSFALYGLALLILLAVSKVPSSFVFKKTLIVIPFVALVALSIPFMKGKDGLALFTGILIKSYLSIFCMTMLTSTTKFPRLLKAMERMKVPSIFIMIMSFMYRYLFVLIDEFHRMQRARDSRSLGRVGRWDTVKVLSNIIGVLFVRSYERAERVYLSMCSRGFNGEIKTLD
ncbi:MAG: cobalt ECF transporter T component CbiQ [Candidatus Omnitrophica bacterium]|nr:cobalt ECF transporter T component CbiQ [Candidatus Omnitrophota bacterium]MBU4589661.1 cobalt ECF transporter T component CbiQ [Candidatus Omnitrophota bacterium]